MTMRSWCFGGPKQLLSSPSDVEVPRRNTSSGIVFGKIAAVFGQDGSCLDAEEVPPLVVPTTPCAQPIYDVLLA
eukprot:1619032-Amphidinium_carterae.1